MVCQVVFLNFFGEIVMKIDTLEVVLKHSLDEIWRHWLRISEINRDIKSLRRIFCLNEKVELFFLKRMFKKEKERFCELLSSLGYSNTDPELLLQAGDIFSQMGYFVEAIDCFNGALQNVNPIPEDVRLLSLFGKIEAIVSSWQDSSIVSIDIEVIPVLRHLIERHIDHVDASVQREIRKRFFFLDARIKEVLSGAYQGA